MLGRAGLNDVNGVIDAGHPGGFAGRQLRGENATAAGIMMKPNQPAIVEDGVSETIVRLDPMFGTATKRQQERKWRDTKDRREPGCKQRIDELNGRGLFRKNGGQVEFGITKRLATRKRQYV